MDCFDLTWYLPELHLDTGPDRQAVTIVRSRKLRRARGRVRVDSVTGFATRGPPPVSLKQESLSGAPGGENGGPGPPGRSALSAPCQDRRSRTAGSSTPEPRVAST